MFEIKRDFTPLKDQNRCIFLFSFFVSTSCHFFLKYKSINSWELIASSFFGVIVKPLILFFCYTNITLFLFYFIFKNVNITLFQYCGIYEKNEINILYLTYINIEIILKSKRPQSVTNSKKCAWSFNITTIQCKTNTNCVIVFGVVKYRYNIYIQIL